VLALFACAGIAEAVQRVRRGAPRVGGDRGGRARAGGIWTQRAVARDDLSIAYYNLGNRYARPRRLAARDRELPARDRGAPGYMSAHNNLALVYEATGEHDARRARVAARARARAGAGPAALHRARRSATCARSRRSGTERAE
jgi:hypothetical protein